MTADQSVFFCAEFRRITAEEDRAMTRDSSQFTGLISERGRVLPTSASENHPVSGEVQLRREN
jgi:hypothetical protein